MKKLIYICKRKIVFEIKYLLQRGRGIIMEEFVEKVININDPKTVFMLCGIFIYAT